ncbi:DoxX family protein [Microbacteriaceae bacterium K1510]|nr:DoxX family protein [Microbacteriaceae bacterium K1510]
MTLRSDSHPALSALDGVAANTSDALLLIGRIMLGLIFLRSGFGKMLDIGTFAAALPARGVPAFFGYIAAPVEFFGGLALVLGFATRYFAALLFVFTVVATLTSHRYWEFADAAMRRAQDGNFFKNLSILGGFVLLFVTGGGRFGLDGLLRRRP